MAWKPFLFLTMQAYFPTTLWDGDSEGRDSDDGSSSAPDWRDWTQMLFEMFAVQNYILNENINLGTRVIYFGPTPEASLSYAASVVELNLAESGINDFRIGDSTNYVNFASNGAMSLAGTAKRKLAARLAVDAIDQLTHSKPTQVEYGVYKMYSMPIYSADNEELFFTGRVPYSWDAASDLEVFTLLALSGAEDVNDTFKFQLSWESIKEDGVLSNAAHDVEVEQTILTTRNAQYTTYDLKFTIDHDVHGGADDIQPGDVIGMRLRRIASSGPEVDNEILFVDAIVDITTDKIFGTWTRD